MSLDIITYLLDLEVRVVAFLNKYKLERKAQVKDNKTYTIRQFNSLLR